MVTVYDVAQYILQKEPDQTLDAMKLQKLTYYCQAWHYTWTGTRLFNEEFQAWANGPVCRDLYDLHRGKYWVRSTDLAEGVAGAIGEASRAIVEDVLAGYSSLSGLALSVLTHQEDPWVLVRGELPSSAKCTRTITVESMAAFYGSLDENDPDVVDVTDPSLAL
jgi:uncharacterized phage-associated protein